ncbi:hypothetical protein PVIIG_05672 [Plasmodium vivax India VII]|uniref:Uncharacterized protein n=1 Tax=Plasmodium vivax India VII TaxID=1077284 RepID=A0A0J9S265_PLAVI|nr:hypothetical protein PVIIG_05672 [Plasmodium vivax India VII]
MSTETENTYYKYQDYLFYRNIFDAAERNPDKYGVDKNHIIFNAIYSNIKDVFIAKCTKIKGYLTHFYTKDNHKENNRCSYINYFINDEVRKHIYRSKSNTFELFINYIKSDSYLKNNTCISNIKYLENKIYNNMKKLYDLYDKYEAFYRNNHYSADTYWCTDLVDLVKDFNTIVRENDKRIRIQKKIQYNA